METGSSNESWLGRSTRWRGRPHTSWMVGAGQENPDAIASFSERRTRISASAHIPGEQTTPLRAELRRLFKSRFGYRGQTVLMNDVLLVTCDQATEQARSTRRRQAADLLDQRSGAEPVDDSGWRIYWHVWNN